MYTRNQDRVGPSTRAALAAIALSIGIVGGALAASPEALYPADLDFSCIDPDSDARAINNLGEITGSVGQFEFSHGGAEIGAVWDATGRLARELLPLPIPLHDDQSRGHDINKHGVVAGVTGEFVGVNEHFPATWNAEGKGTALELLPQCQRGEATAINDRGTIIGFCHTTSGNSDKFPMIWDSSGAPRALQMPSGFEPYAAPQDINNRGEAVGSRRSTKDHKGVAIKWAADGTPSILPPPSGFDSASANGISRFGVVVGTASDGITKRATKWKPNGIIKILPPLPDDDESMAVSINRYGVVLGYSYKGSTKTVVTWDRKGIPTAHRQLRGFDHLDRLGNINDKGAFVGRQSRYDDDEIDKITKAGAIWY